MTVTFYNDKWNEETLRKRGLNQEQIKAVKYVKQNDEITNKERQEINDCSRNTATNDLSDLTRKLILKESAKKVPVLIMLLHNDCTYYTSIERCLHNNATKDAKRATKTP